MKTSIEHEGGSKPGRAGMKVLALSSSPRRNGNSHALAMAVLEGAEQSGCSTELVYLDDYLQSFLRDCRACRDDNGRCTIEDGFDELFRDKFLPSHAIIFATPVYWYGLSGQLKTFLDRIFCYIASSYPASEQVIRDLVGKRLVLVLSSEESYVGASLGVLHEMQEYARYTHSALVGVVNGVGNKRGDVRLDPSNPIDQARDIGRRLFDLRSTDYRIDTDRLSSVWRA